VLPLFANLQNESSLLADLQNMCANGLRTLVCGQAQQPMSWWEGANADEYHRVIKMDPSDDSAGHSDKRCKPDKCEKCVAHRLFERLENEADFRFLGCTGLEDQLQHHVSESIEDYIKAGIRVWMITGDKLETAKNIGIACSLIDPDMEVQLPENGTMDDCVKAYSQARLIQVTGAWSKMANSQEELSSLFDIFDTDHSGVLDMSSMTSMLQSLNFAVSTSEVEKMFNDADTDGSGTIDKEEFQCMMQSARLSMYQAVKYDIEEGIKRYNQIDDNATYPVSILVNRDAFLAMFPGKLTAAELVEKTRREAEERKADDDFADDSDDDDDGKNPRKRSSRISMQKVFGSIGSSKKKDGSKAKAKKARWRKFNPMAEPTESELEELRSKFFQLASVSKSVVFARAQPSMKKKMVTEIQKRVPSAVTLAIGDGANDTDMIKAANVGVGIAGIEGTAATNSADYAIGAFR
jgi:magnesium-transporting ATPase (P-type)